MAEISDLKAGMEFKNYKELCILLGIKVKTGDAKKNHIMEIERFVELEFIKHKIKVVKVYDVPKEKVITGNVLPYNELMEQLLLKILFDERNKKSVWTRSQLYNALYLYNKHYYDYAFNKKELSEILNVDIRIVEDVFNSTYSEFKNSLFKRISSLEKKGIIAHEEVWMIQDIILLNQVVDDKGEVNKGAIIETGNKYRGEIKTKQQRFVIENRKATDEEILSVMAIKRDLLKELNVISEYQLGNKWKLYDNMLRKRLVLELGVNGFFKGHIFHFDDNSISERDLLPDKELVIELIKLNYWMYESGSKKGLYRHRRAKELIDSIYNHSFGEIKIDDLTLLRAEDSYPLDLDNVLKTVIVRDYEKPFDQLKDIYYNKKENKMRGLEIDSNVSDYKEDDGSFDNLFADDYK